MSMDCVPISPDELLRLAARVGEGWERELRALDAATRRKWRDIDDRSLAEIMDRNLDALSLSNVWGPANRLPSGTIWTRAEPFFRLGSLQTHARQKPAGYAGDYLLLDRIQREDVRGEDMAASFDRYFLRHAAPQAVRNRARLTAERMVDCVRGAAGPARVLSLGSGAAWDVRSALRMMRIEERSAVEIVLLDLDPHALEFAADAIRREFPGQLRKLETRSVNLRRLAAWIAHPDSRELFRHARFVACLGFLDYLDDSLATAWLRAVWEQVPGSCEVMCFAFGDRNPSRGFMEWIGNWYVIHRSPEQVRELAIGAGMRHAMVAVEPAGVNLYLHAARRDG